MNVSSEMPCDKYKSVDVSGLGLYFRTAMPGARPSNRPSRPVCLRRRRHHWIASHADVEPCLWSRLWGQHVRVSGVMMAPCGADAIVHCCLPVWDGGPCTLRKPLQT